MNAPEDLPLPWVLRLEEPDPKPLGSVRGEHVTGQNDVLFK